MKKLFLIPLFVISMLFYQNAWSNIYEVEHLRVIEVSSSINPATLNHLKEQYKQAKSNKNPAILIKLNTPGGLVTTTKDILTLIGSQDFPTFIWITPEGASATSAGAIIASSAHLLFMSNGTNIGAATPVGLGKDIKQEDGKAKAINDLVALVTSLAESRGRDKESFKSMIEKASSFSAQEALKSNIINNIISNKKELYENINDQKIILKGKQVNITLNENVEIYEAEMDLGLSLLNIFANPSTAYVLFLIGAALLYFEFQAPGGFIAGALGVFFLIIAAIGFQVLPLNFGAFALVILAFAFFILEVYITSYGILTLAGVASLIGGSLFLFRTENSYLEIELPVILSSVAAITLYVLVIGFFMIKTRRNKSKKFFSPEAHIGKVISVINEEDNVYTVKVNGEIWKTIHNDKLKIGEKVNIESINNENMTIQIRREK